MGPVMAHSQSPYPYHRQTVKPSCTHATTESLSNDEPVFTFGVELECIMIFHEKLIQDHVQKMQPSSHLAKEINDEEEVSLRHSLRPKTPYNSWAVHDASTSMLRPYQDEPLRIMKNLVDQSITPTPEIIVHSGDTKQSTHHTWSLSQDYSLTGIPHKELPPYIKKIKPSTTDNFLSWDSSGVELISPPYPSTTLASTFEADLVSLLNSIQYSPSAALTNTPLCGFHVHVGLSNGAPFPLGVIQHLAYLTLVYEDAISTLHHPYRRSWGYVAEQNPYQQHLEADLKSNRDEILTFGCESETFKREDGTTMRCNYKPLSWIRRQIFDVEDSTAIGGLSAEEKILRLVGQDRGRFVAFAPLAREEVRGRARTVEFRQHRGTTDPVEVRHWVRFCVGLVGLAWRYYRVGGECGVKSWRDGIDLEDLWEEMRLGEGERKYWREKREEYGGLVPGWKPVPLWEEDDFEDEVEDEVEF
ncbi:MAG: hypothetical protein M1820_003354 [Bogoriella megaspora]|nr:MAG: hypothetical protein M1820_003354 [Bogoriella megaspora]